MIRRLLRWQFWRWRYREMRRRVKIAERQLQLEMWRNRAREDELITAPQRLQGLWGMPARGGPAVRNISPPPQRALTASNDPWDSLTGADKMEFDLEWRQAGENAGLSLQQTKEQFLREVVMPRRMPLNDDPFGGSH